MSRETGVSGSVDGEERQGVNSGANGSGAIGAMGTGSTSSMLIMATRSYFDGSNGDGWMVVGGIVGDETYWPEFQQDWLKALTDGGVPNNPQYDKPYFHAREANSGRGLYEGFTASMVSQLVGSLLDVVGHHALGSPRNLVPFTCAIDVKAHNALRRENKNIPRPESVCMDWMMLGVFSYDPSDHPRGIELVFDRNERFAGVVSSIWQKKKQPAPWTECVSGIKSVDMRQYEGVQIADLFAWAERRYQATTPANQSPVDCWARKYVVFILKAQPYRIVLDSDWLSNAFLEDGTYNSPLRIPRRGVNLPRGTMLRGRKKPPHD